MPSCPEALQHLAGFAEAAKALHDSSVLSACIQYDATLQAGNAQANAAWFSGVMTILAGLAAVAAALIGAVVAYLAVTRQIENDRRLQREQQTYDVKKEVYLRVNVALFEGLMCIGKLADLRVPTETILAPFHNKAPDVSLAHVVADVATARTILAVLRELMKAQLELGNVRLPMVLQMPAVPVPDIAAFGRTCISRINTMKSPFVEAVVAMRTELGLMVDRTAYEAMLDDFIDDMHNDAMEAMDAVEKLFAGPRQ